MSPSMLALTKRIAFLLLTFIGLHSTAETNEEARDFNYFPKIITVFPTVIGAGAGASYQNHYEINLIYGLTPTPYSDTIASLAATSSGNSSYQEVIKAAFQNNSQIRLALQYHFISPTVGWHLGFSFARLSSSGEADIESVLYAATGRDYTTLMNLLRARGRSTAVSMESTLSLAELQTGYSWELSPDLGLSVDLGISKVTASTVTLETGLPNFEASAAGSSLLRSSEEEIETIIDDYGVAPTLAVSFIYLF